ncbi:MAG: DUF5009 domain-containing protein [Verrucomicrobiales bacterium]|nr:DUF5009 domain-containing protein [Verrucomicrobiales bacterium]
MTHSPSSDSPPPPHPRVTSVDALRGFVMFMMIFVNDLASAGRVVPDSMVHFSDRHAKGSGMTFVDLVFPAFLFIVGMSIPLAFGSRAERGQPAWRSLSHILGRTLSLLTVGILMVHETPDAATMGWSGNLWCVLMYLSSIAAFCSFAPAGVLSEAERKRWQTFSLGVRWLGRLALLTLALVFRDTQGGRILSLYPLSLSTQWYGILGLIGWAYLVACLVFLTFSHHRTAILGCLALLMCLFPADRAGAFEGFWLARIVGIGDVLGALPAISVAGLLLGSMVSQAESISLTARAKFTLWFVAGCSAAALLLHPLYGISKNQATPSWCFWSCAITATAWFIFHLACEVRPSPTLTRPLVLAGHNVLLAYLLSEMVPGLLAALGWAGAYGNLAANLPAAITRSTLCAVVILFVSVGLNRIGFRLRL